jgi:ribonuclease BN (tRNA processing enzyme)
MDMKLLFLGAAAAFTLDPNNYQSNMLLVADNGKKLLIDCGTDIRWALDEVNVHHADLDAVYISHLHADHIGGLEWFAFSTKFFQDNGGRKPTLFAHESVANSLWDQSLRGGLSSLQGEVASLESFFHNCPVAKSFTWENIEFTLVKTLHVKINNCYMPSYGLFFEINGTKIFLTTDAVLAPELFNEYYEKADIIFHDCETLTKPSSAHANYKDLIKFPEEIKRKMWLYDYNDGKLPNPKKDGFIGFVVKGQEFIF